MFTNLNIDPSRKPRFLGELGALSHAQVSSAEFKYQAGAEIFGDTEPADYIYEVIEGAVRSYKLLFDGRRQIGAFHLAGDIFGLENGDLHRFTAEAIVDTTVRLMKRESLERVAKTDSAIVRSILNMTTDNLQHSGKSHASLDHFCWPAAAFRPESGDASMTLIPLLHDIKPTSCQKLAMRTMLKSLLGKIEFDRLSPEVTFGTIEEDVLPIFVGAENCAAEIKLHHLDNFAVAAEFALGQPIRMVNVLVAN